MKISLTFLFVLVIVVLAIAKVDGAPRATGYGLLGGLSTSSSNYYSSTSGLYNQGYTSIRPPYYNSYSYNRPGGYGYNSYYNGYRPGGGYYSGGGSYYNSDSFYRPGGSFYPNSYYNSYNRPFLSGGGIGGLGGYDSGYYYNRPGCYGSVGCSGGYPGTGLGLGTNYLGGGGYNY